MPCTQGSTEPLTICGLPTVGTASRAPAPAACSKVPLMCTCRGLPAAVVQQAGAKGSAPGASQGPVETCMYPSEICWLSSDGLAHGGSDIASDVSSQDWHGKHLHQDISSLQLQARQCGLPQSSDLSFMASPQGPTWYRWQCSLSQQVLQVMSSKAKH